MWETWVQSLGQEDLWEKEMATHSSILAWRIPWMEDPGGLQSMGSQRVGHDWATSLCYQPGLWTRAGSSIQFSRSVVSNSLRLHGLQHSGLPCPSPTPGAYSNSCASSRWCHRITWSAVVRCRFLTMFQLPHLKSRLIIAAFHRVADIIEFKALLQGHRSGAQNQGHRQSWLSSFITIAKSPLIITGRLPDSKLGKSPTG